MVYITFPTNHTEEEQMLQAKYQKLKKKKKALQAHKAPKQETEKQLIPKRAVDARDAREVARKLFKSGAIPAIQKPQMKQDQMSFKRPKGQERKRVVPESNVASYQPFSATQGSDSFQSANTAATLDRDANRVHNLYQQIATERDREERGLTEKKTAEPALTTRTDKQRTGNTICVSGNNVTEEFLRNQFATFGKIVSVSMEIEKGRGFITFIKTESAEKAISEMHSKTISGISLQVQLARRQPQIEPINHASSSVVWSTLAASHSQKGGSAKDKRKMVEYDDDDIFN
ncbi:negative elongation factor E [Contarinia nasturtii]|uniref:negative elongation factor E n=1 Tax=Contarinia nasturtii TaxID=265458 RepID=UPI0012D3E3EB|nr:negative elongation factor E [Contarinia nasturtii]